jgi:hypothetical protein
MNILIVKVYVNIDLGIDELTTLLEDTFENIQYKSK